MEVGSATTIAQLYLRSCESHSELTALRYAKGHDYECVSYARLRQESLAFAVALRSIGVGHGDRVLLLSENRPEWVIADFAMACIGAVNVPVHSVLSPEQVREIVEEAHPCAAIISGAETFTRLEPALHGHLRDAPVVVFDEVEHAAAECRVSLFRDLVGDPAHQSQADSILELAAGVTPDDLMSITFTSGTTARQKGVKLTHRNLMADIRPGLTAHPYHTSDRLLSVLPLSHVYERVAGHYGPIAGGSSIRHIVSLDEVKEAASEQRPTVMVAVPRLFEKVKEAVESQSAASPIKRRILGLAFDPTIASVAALKPVFDKLVYSRVRAALGGQLRCAIIGGAKLPVAVSSFFDTVGIPLLEGYGLTETSPIVSTNREANNRYGTVGLPLDGVLVRIADDGEIQVKGDIVMAGYLRDDDTAEAFTEDGWLKTGDLGDFDDQGHLFLTGRKKDLIVLTTGKKVAPSGVEEALTCSPHIEQACVVGDGRKHICAVLVPSADALAKAIGEGLASTTSPGGRVYEFLAEEAGRATSHLSTIERVRAIVVASEPFTPDNGMLTPTLKMVRRSILNRHQEQIDRLYA